MHVFIQIFNDKKICSWEPKFFVLQNSSAVFESSGGDSHRFCETFRDARSSDEFIKQRARDFGALLVEILVLNLDRIWVCVHIQDPNMLPQMAPHVTSRWFPLRRWAVFG